MDDETYCPVCGHAYADTEHGCSECTKPTCGRFPDWMKSHIDDAREDQDVAP